jgi:cation diffusion facilitator CzcD-associated flavoprotein CzcO
VWELTLQHLVSGVGDLSEYDRAQKIKGEGVNTVYVHQEVVRAKVVVSAVGGLVEPKIWPEEVPGKEIFAGPVFHSARWRYDVDLKNKDVVVIGTGCSAAQFIPQLTKEYGAKSVTQLMRSPPWVVPRMRPPFGEENCKANLYTVLRFLVIRTGLLGAVSGMVMNLLSFYKLLKQLLSSGPLYKFT